jgi:hypothetical protein
LFSSSIKGNEELSFGRFPILSLCYLYGAKKILKNHKVSLLKIKDYKVVDEEIDLYQKFKTVAGKILRLYIKDNIIVSPLEMMAILGMDRELKRQYSKYTKNECIIKNINSIYVIKNQSAVISEFGISIERKIYPILLY